MTDHRRVVSGTDTGGTATGKNRHLRASPFGGAGSNARRGGALRSALVVLLLAAGSTSFTSAALADVTDPLPGVRLVRRGGNQSLAIADLCTPGVSVRATRHAERTKTAPQWAAASGVQVAINADFFDASYRVWGRARGASEDWPGDTHFRQAGAGEFRGYFMFGPGKVALETNAQVGPPGAPEVSEIIGGHITLVHQGQSLAPFGDIITKGNRRQRTAVGYSQDRRKLYLFTSQKNIDGEEIVADFASMVAEGGAPPIWDASSVDGGGSTQMFVQGPGAVLSASRQVANHLGIHASGSGAAPQCPNKAPRGALDSTGCDFVTGWAQDEDRKDTPIAIKVGWGGGVDAAGVTTTAHTAAEHRDDLCSAIGSCAHGYQLLSPYALHDGAPHDVFVAGVDDGGGAVTFAGPKALQCTTAIPNGVRRWVTNPDVLAAWRFSLFEGALPASDAQIDAVNEGSAWPAKPRMIVAKGGNGKVYVVDGKLRRHIPSPRVLGDWHFDGATIETLPQAEVDTYVEAPSLRARPTLLHRSSGHVYVIDDTESAGAGGKAGANAGGSSGGGSSTGGNGGGGASAGNGGGTGAAGGGGGTGAAGKAGATSAGQGGASGRAGAGGKSGSSAGGNGGANDGVTIDFGAPGSQDGGTCAAGRSTDGLPRHAVVGLVMLLGAARCRRERRTSVTRR